MKVVVGNRGLNSTGSANRCFGFTEILDVLSPGLRRVVSRLDSSAARRVTEIRIRANRPLQVVLDAERWFVDYSGRASSPDTAYCPSVDDCIQTLQLMGQWSVYALEHEMRSGYLTLPGGHRVGFTGEAVMEAGQVRLLRNVTGLNIRLARQVLGAGLEVAKAMVRSGNPMPNTLVIGPPNSGKTTLIRDVARLLGTGDAREGIPCLKVGIVDERSEIAACHGGVPQYDVGLATDVLDRCLKAQGIEMLLRSMSPEIIITDEIGREEDVNAVYEAARSGVCLVSTAHALNLDDARRRPVVARLLSASLFEQVVVLSCRSGPGTVEEIRRLN